MKKLFLLALITLVLSSCSSNQEVMNLDNGVMVNQMVSKVDKQKIQFTELVFGNQHIDKQTDIQQTLFENFGSWTGHVFTKGSLEPVLIWENVQLFDKTKDTYTLVSYGGRLNKNAVAILLVLDSHGKDVLNTSQKLQNKVITKMTQLLQRKSRSQNFLLTYTQTFHPTIKNVEEYVYGYNYNPIRIGDKTVKFPSESILPRNTDSSGSYVLGINFASRTPSPRIAPREYMND